MKCPVLLSLFLGTVVLGQPSISDEAIWKDFTTSLQKQAPNSKPGELIRGYRENLIRRGLAADEAGSRTGVVSNFISTRRRASLGQSLPRRPPQGWAVTGFDPSSEGKRAARYKAGQRRREDDLTPADLMQFWKALRPGGIVCMKTGGHRQFRDQGIPL